MRDPMGSSETRGRAAGTRRAWEGIDGTAADVVSDQQTGAGSPEPAAKRPRLSVDTLQAFNALHSAVSRRCLHPRSVY